ncbi:MAG: hypothetical protein SF182_04650 [Deltaproteobacteria bacterium]|nr:hypothetical protein [Deltaproteobacteria bacterium]
MMLRRLEQLAIGVLAVVAPAAAVAQVSGSVITGPLAVGAPALGWPALAVLTIGLAAGALLMMRRVPRSAARVIAGLALVLAAAAGRAAVLSVIISGDECHRVTKENYSPVSEIILQNQCANPVRILDLQLSCIDAMGAQEPSEAIPFPPCEIGLTLPAGESCELPLCQS